MKNGQMMFRCIPLIILGIIFTSMPALTGEVKIALDSPRDSKMAGTYVWAKTFADHLAGKGMIAQLFDRDALGNEDEKLDQICQGLLEVSCSDLGKVGQLDPTIFGFTLPFLFDSVAHFDRVLYNTGLLADINKKLAKRGTRVLTLVPIGGFAGLLNTKKTIKTPADMKDLRFRAMDNKQVTWLDAWGSSSVIIPWPEIYSSLQTGVADGYLNVPIVPIMFKHTEIIKYFSNVEFGLPIRIIICSQDWYAGLNDKERSIVKQGIEKADANARVLQRKLELSGLEALRKAGVEVYENTAQEKAMFARPLKSRYMELLDPGIAKQFVIAADSHR